MLINVAGEPARSPASISDDALRLAFQGKFALTLDEAEDCMRGFQALSRNPQVKVPLALEDHRGKPVWTFVLTDDAVEPIVERWIRAVPVVAEQFRTELLELKSALYHENGMSQGGLSRLMTHVPTTLFYMLKAYEENFWDNRKQIERFLAAYPMMKGKA